MSALDMNPATLPADAQALYEKMAARRKAQGEGFGGPYLALLNHPELARRIEELGFFLKFEGALPRTIYQFIVLTVARATGASGFEGSSVRNKSSSAWARVESFNATAATKAT